MITAKEIADEIEQHITNSILDGFISGYDKEVTLSVPPFSGEEKCFFNLSAWEKTSNKEYYFRVTVEKIKKL